MHEQLIDLSRRAGGFVMNGYGLFETDAPARAHRQWRGPAILGLVIRRRYVSGPHAGSFEHRLDRLFGGEWKACRIAKGDGRLLEFHSSTARHTKPQPAADHMHVAGGIRNRNRQLSGFVEPAQWNDPVRAEMPTERSQHRWRQVTDRRKSIRGAGAGMQMIHIQRRSPVRCTISHVAEVVSYRDRQSIRGQQTDIAADR